MHSDEEDRKVASNQSESELNTTFTDFMEDALVKHSFIQVLFKITTLFLGGGHGSTWDMSVEKNYKQPWLHGAWGPVFSFIKVEERRIETVFCEGCLCVCGGGGAGGRKLAKLSKILLRRCWVCGASDICRQRFTEGEEK